MMKNHAQRLQDEKFEDERYRTAFATVKFTRLVKPQKKKKRIPVSDVFREIFHIGTYAQEALVQHGWLSRGKGNGVQWLKPNEFPSDIECKAIQELAKKLQSENFKPPEARPAPADVQQALDPQASAQQQMSLMDLASPEQRERMATAEAAFIAETKRVASEILGDQPPDPGGVH